MIPIKNAKIVYSNLRGEAHEFNASGDRYIIVRVYEDDDAFDALSKVCRVKTVQNAKLRYISVKVRIPREDSNNKELKDDVIVKALNTSINSKCSYSYDDIIRYGSAIDVILTTLDNVTADIEIKPVSYINPRTKETGYVLYLKELKFSYVQEVH